MLPIRRLLDQRSDLEMLVSLESEWEESEWSKKTAAPDAGLGELLQSGYGRYFDLATWNKLREVLGYR